MTVALDLFAGTGWGVALQHLGIAEHGVELMPAAVATREANGMRTAFTDVWDGLRHPPLVPEHDLLIASPPCQTFSVAGGGAGRQALDEVVALIDSGAWLDPDELRSFGAAHDDRTALVLTPLTYAMRYRPDTIVLEQVPPVLPVWQAIGRVLSRNGYQVATAVLSAEQYGVPQTRKRAILVAAKGRAVHLPTPTHSAYYSRDPQRLDPGVQPWVSMAEALGWGMTQRPYLSVAAGTSNGGTDPAALGGSGARRILNGERDAGPQHWALQGHQYPNGPAGGRQERSGHLPAQTITSGARMANWVAEAHRGAGMLERHGARPGRTLDQPAFTVRAGGGTAPGGFRLRELDPSEVVHAHTGDWSVSRERTAAEPAHTVTSKVDHHRWHNQSGTPVDKEWPAKRPATTVAHRDLLQNPGHTQSRHDSSTKSRNDGIKVTAEEAACLQSYPDGFRWVGTKTSTFQQIGNAVPPLLALRVLEAALGL